MKGIKLAAGACVVAVSVAAAVALVPAELRVVHVFPGQNGPNPPDAPTVSADMMGGVSPRFLVGLINGGFTVRSKTDGKEVQPYQTLQQFWEAAFKNSGQELPAKPYDPKILFDPLSSRWFAASDGWGTPMSKHWFIAVSADDDPTHAWKAVDYEANVLVDNVKLAVDKYSLYSTALPAGRVESPKTPILVMPKSDLLWKGSTGPSLEHANYFEAPVNRLPDNKADGAEGLVPALDLDPDKKRGEPVVYVNRYRTEVDGETFIQVRKITWTSPTKAALSEPVNIGLGAHYGVQPTTRGIQPALPDGLHAPGLAPSEGRAVNAVAHDGSVWTIAATEINNRVGAFWAQIDVKTMKLVQHGTLADPEADLLFPSLSVDARGNLGIAMSRTSATEALSTYVTGRLRTDPPNTLRPLVRAVQGRYVFFNKNTDLTKPGQGVPTSDYATTVLDPSDRTLFWSYQFAATNDCMPKETNAGRYATHWVAFRVDGAAATKR